VLCVESVFQTCPQAEILILDSGCKKTQALVENLQKRIPFLSYHLIQADRGKGDAIAYGISKAKGDILVQFDADLQFDARDILKLTQAIQENKADMSLGSRFLSSSMRTQGSSNFTRFLGNKIISSWCSFLYQHPISDALAGMKAWKKEVTQSFKLDSVNYSYEVELFAKALKQGFKVIDVPIYFQARLYGSSSVSVFKAGLQILKDSLLFRINA